jgi:hypothetical protein
VKSGIFSNHTILALLALAVGACASQQGTTTVTAADVGPPTGQAKESSVQTSAKAQENAPAGKLACRSTTRDEGTVELYLDWNGKEAKGLLRRTAPSGMVSDLIVHAERVKDAIIADDPNSTDLVSHAAVVGEHGGKKYIRLGDSKQNWAPCE